MSNNAIKIAQLRRLIVAQRVTIISREIAHLNSKESFVKMSSGLTFGVQWREVEKMLFLDYLSFPNLLLRRINEAKMTTFTSQSAMFAYIPP